METDKLVDFDHVTDYISRETVMRDILCEPPDAHYPSWYAERIAKIPAADVRPVVRCLDCVYYNTTGCADGFGWCEGVMVSKGTSDDFFCAEGKQKPYECGAEMERNLDTTKGDNHD